MSNHTEKKCPQCGQRLRFPDNIGGMLMACPTCGNKFSSDFKLSCERRSSHLEKLIKLFGIPLEK